MAIRFVSKEISDRGKLEWRLSVSNLTLEKPTTNEGSERTLKWRRANPDRYREYMKAYMAKRRKK